MATGGDVVNFNPKTVAVQSHGSGSGTKPIRDADLEINRYERRATAKGSSNLGGTAKFFFATFDALAKPLLAPIDFGRCLMFSGVQDTL